MQKVKQDFQVADQEISFGNVYIIEQLTQLSRNEINTPTERLVQKHNNFLQLKRSYLVLKKEKRKQGNKSKKLTESLHLMVEIAKRSNDNMILVSENLHQ